MPGLVSVVIPTCNHHAFVRDTLNSVVSQSYSPLEIIVTDDGSSDGTQEIIKEFAASYPNIFPVLHPENTGIAANVNRGRSLVSGEFLAWLGGDDLMLPNKLEKQVYALRDRPDALACCHDAEVFEFPSGRVLGLFTELYNGGRHFREGSVELWFEPGYHMLPSTMMYRTSAVPARGYDERLRYTNDWLHDVETFRNGKCIALNEVLGRYRRHQNNVTNSLEMREHALEDMLLALAIIDARYPELHHLCRQSRADRYLTAATKAQRSERPRNARQWAKSAIREGALLRGPLLLLGLRFFGDYISRQSSLPQNERSGLLRWLAAVTLRARL